MDGAGGEPANAQGGDPATYLVIAMGDAVVGQDEAFNTWYDTVHEPDIPSCYLMMMTLVTSDLPAMFRGVLAGGPPSPALDRTRGFGYTYRVVGP